MGWPATGLLRDRYRLIGLIGRGGMGSVYHAHDEFLDRDVAVKIFDASKNPADTSRQEEEVNVLARLSHHSIVTLLDASIDRSNPERPRVYFVMELVTGKDLRRTLDDERLSPRQIAQIGFDLAEGLQYIHHLGVTHRDIKPANIMLVDYGDNNTRARAKLTDFGIAVRVGAPQEAVEGVTTGTAAYLSPEQVSGGLAGHASDVYALGLVLLECFTGVVAYPGDPIPSAMARLTREPEFPADLSPEWTQLLSAMTARDPAARPIATELVAAMRDAVIAETGRHRIEPDDDSPGTLWASQTTGATTISRPAPVSASTFDEPARMAAVMRYELLDTPPDGTFDRITSIAARLFSAPVALVSIVDHDRIWFKSRHGLEIDQISRDPGLCSSAVMQDAPWVIENARLDPRTLANPLVASEFGLQFYLGVPLRTTDGYNLGTLCVLDFEPRTVTQDEVAALEDLAALVMREMDLRLEQRRAARGEQLEESVATSL